VVVFGSGAAGEPTVSDWADWSGTIEHEIVTRIGARVPRRAVGTVGPAVGARNRMGSAA
jgi:alanine racemase